MILNIPTNYMNPTFKEDDFCLSTCNGIELDSMRFTLRLNLKKEPDQDVERDYERNVIRGSKILEALVRFFEEKKPEFVERAYNEEGDLSFSSLRKNVLSSNVVFQRRIVVAGGEAWVDVQSSEIIQEADVIRVLNLNLDTRHIKRRKREEFFKFSQKTKHSVDIGLRRRKRRKDDCGRRREEGGSSLRW